MTFVAITAARLLAVFNARTEYGSGFAGAHKNPILWIALAVSVVLEVAALTISPPRGILGLTTIPAQAWVYALALSVLPLVLTQGTRIVQARNTRSPEPR